MEKIIRAMMDLIADTNVFRTDHIYNAERK